MFRFPTKLGTALLAFGVGVLAVLLVSPAPTRTTLKEISEKTASFDGTIVEFETYVQINLLFDKGWTAGEPFEKHEVLTIVEPSAEPLGLRIALEKGLSAEEYFRVRAIVRGRVRDNCRPSLSFTCCFGKSIAITEAEIVPIAEPIRYLEPHTTDKPELPAGVTS